NKAFCSVAVAVGAAAHVACAGRTQVAALALSDGDDHAGTTAVAAICRVRAGWSRTAGSAALGTVGELRARPRAIANTGRATGARGRRRAIIARVRVYL